MFSVGLSRVGYVCELHSPSRIPPFFYSTSLTLDAVRQAPTCPISGLPLAGSLEEHEATKHFAPIKRVSKFRLARYSISVSRHRAL